MRIPLAWLRDFVDVPWSAKELGTRLTMAGFELEALHELYAPDGDPDEVRYYMPRGWAQRWPGEEVWVARRRSAD